jgi:hypothetical protein
MKLSAFWDVPHCSLVEIDRSYRDVYRPPRTIALMKEAVHLCETSVYFCNKAPYLTRLSAQELEVSLPVSVRHPTAEEIQ